MYVSYEDRPICPVCKKKLQLRKIIGSNINRYHWHCNCLVSIEYENVEPDFIIYTDEEDD